MDQEQTRRVEQAAVRTRIAAREAPASGTATTTDSTEGAGTAGTAVLTRNRHDAIQRAAMRSLLLIPALSLVALLGLASAYRPAPPATGDALVDELRSELDAPGGWPWTSAPLDRMADLELLSGWQSWLTETEEE